MWDQENEGKLRRLNQWKRKTLSNEKRKKEVGKGGKKILYKEMNEKRVAVCLKKNECIEKNKGRLWKRKLQQQMYIDKKSTKK